MTKPTLTVRISSFSFKKGLPQDPSGNGGGHVFDCRIIPNPGILPEYKELTGMNEPVGKYLEKQEQTKTFKQSVFGIANQSIERYLEREFTHLMISFGCTGGQHRSVYFAETLAKHVKENFNVTVLVDHIVQEVYKEL